METAEGPEGPERCGPAYSEALQACVTLTCGKHHLYISRQIVKSAVLKPQIQPIPGASGRIAGLSEFDGRPLVYYDPAGTGNQRRLESYQFGIVLKDTCGSLYGIVGDLLGEDGGGEENLTPVREGIWEKCCDQADRI